MAVAMYHGTAVSPTLANWTDYSLWNLLKPTDSALYVGQREPAIPLFALFAVLVAGIQLSSALQVPLVESSPIHQVKFS